MGKVSFDFIMTKQCGATVTVPDEIIEQGDKAIKDYLWRKGHIDHALDHPSTYDQNLNVTTD